jgi:hypothetical protein
LSGKTCGRRKEILPKVTVGVENAFWVDAADHDLRNPTCLAILCCSGAHGASSVSFGRREKAS